MGEDDFIILLKQRVVKNHFLVETYCAENSQFGRSLFSKVGAVDSAGNSKFILKPLFS